MNGARFRDANLPFEPLMQRSADELSLAAHRFVQAKKSKKSFDGTIILFQQCFGKTKPKNSIFSGAVGAGRVLFAVDALDRRKPQERRRHFFIGSPHAIKAPTGGTFPASLSSRRMTPNPLTKRPANRIAEYVGVDKSGSVRSATPMHIVGWQAAPPSNQSMIFIVGQPDYWTGVPHCAVCAISPRPQSAYAARK
jgi:dienelactone hydrolase